MSERNTVDPRLLSPDYWKDLKGKQHSFEDGCPSPNGPLYDRPRSLRQIGKARKFARNILDAYLSAGDRTVIKNYNVGQLFEVGGDHLEGTILYFEQEELLLKGSQTFAEESWAGKQERQYEEPYSRLGYWAVVARYREDGRSKLTVIKFEANPDRPDSFYPFGQPLVHPDIRVGEVDHWRVPIDGSDKLKRVTTLQVHQLGNTVKEEVRLPKFLPRWGTIFHRA